MYFKQNVKTHLHRDGHVMGKRRKRQSQGNANRKRGSFNRSKPSRGQGR